MNILTPKTLFIKVAGQLLMKFQIIFYKKKYPLKYWVTVVNKQVKDVIARNSMVIFTKFVQRFVTSWYFNIQILVEHYKTIREKKDNKFEHFYFVLYTFLHCAYVNFWMFYSHTLFNTTHILLSVYSKLWYYCIIDFVRY